MVDERDDKYELPDDGEYHFSDDQVNYDIDPDVVKVSEPDAKGGAVAVSGISQYRRPLIGIVVFVVLIFLVYKLLAPATITPATDLTPVAAPAITAKPATPTPTAAPNNVQANTNPVVNTPPAQLPLPQQTSAPANAVAPAAPTTLIPPPTATTTTTTTTSPNASVNVPLPTQTSVTDSYDDTPSMSSVEKLAIMQQQNTKIITQLQAETTSRFSGYQAQATEMENRLQQLSAHISKIETAVTQLSKALEEIKSGMQAGAAPAAMQAGPVTVQQPLRAASTSSAPRIRYTVQAIIPGRAWLKSESGETITVAEGDMLKNAGRIMKIDPYDGVVEIDMNGHIISLSYGTNNE